ncbi:DUF5916 domain-containing protein [Microscilla marina]|uniref:Uncharacterized protein n=1 Tax=Microscilla marina ATCC 23134 TaxID=313606 RepID=A1ZTK1_MICM2|nr:DUF5916 domain-containing protein [Microscilla marina]EAY26261.1 hypothetical protein M23134_01584 [Microscilla marina ATCC 23134]
MKNFKTILLNVISFLIFKLGIFSSVYAQKIFEPPPQDQKKIIKATQITANLKIDGVLNESVWAKAKKYQAFTQVEPNQGQVSDFITEVKVLYNDQYLYIGAFCKDSLGKKGLRVPNLRRDFDWGSGDLFGVVIDAFRDERNAISFQTNPYGARRDMQVFDSNIFDTDWDGFWKVRTSRTDEGWIAEMRIPWATIRYPKGDHQEWGINFVRRARRVNEISSWAAYPRAFNPYRMSYAGILKGIKPPPPSTNIRVQPYVFASANRNNDSTNLFASDNLFTKMGGEVKWAITPNTVLDFTVNTDFAQTDVDRQVVNLTRFSVFLPERRQFFLENASLFAAGSNDHVQPFFSRTIGLDNQGNPIPIDAGLRLTHRSSKRSMGALMVRQRGLGDSPAANFGVLRYVQNFGKQNRLGGMVTARYDEALEHQGIQDRYNFTGTIDGFFRFNRPLSWQFYVSGSETKDQNSNGWAGYSSLRYRSNQWYFYYDYQFIEKNYESTAGFVRRRNYMANSGGGYAILRPSWKPKFIRSYEPGVFATVIHRNEDRQFLESSVTFFPIWILFQDGSRLVGEIEPTRQNLLNTFSPLLVDIAQGEYDYTRYRLTYSSDISKKLSFYLQYETGNFFDGQLDTYQARLTTAPIPHTYFSVNYQYNNARQLGTEKESKEAHLIAPELRLALNARVQLNAFYQYNSLSKFANWNIRFSWEFQPLSFIYLVFNDTQNEGLTSVQHAQQVIGKVTYLKQF